MPDCQSKDRFRRSRRRTLLAASLMLAVTTLLAVTLLWDAGLWDAGLWHAGAHIDLSGPAAPVDIPQAPALDAYLAAREARVPDLVPGTEKIIRWAVAPGVPTPLALVYLHGFSASRMETWPLMDEVAEALGANLFETRLTGHGSGSQALAEATLADWQRDAREAWVIGQRIGARVVLVGASNGGALAAWLASGLSSGPEAADLGALVLLSPNNGPRDRLAELLTWPGAELLTRLLVGPEYGFTPRNPLHGKYWTTRYPSSALITMMQVVTLARVSPVELIQAPVLVLYSPQDQVVNAAGIERLFHRFRAPQKALMPLQHTSDAEHHTLAGEIRAPADTARVRELILAFLRANLPIQPDHPAQDSAQN